MNCKRNALFFCAFSLFSFFFLCTINGSLSAQAWTPVAGTNDIVNPNIGGNVGIGAPPISKLTVKIAQSDGIWLAGAPGQGTAGTTNLVLLCNTTQGAWNALTQPGDNMIMWKGSNIDVPDAGNLVLGPWSNSPTGMRITYTGNVLIGKSSQTNTAYKLDVAGNARANKLVVNTDGADYVFDSTYRLAPLAEVADSIRANHHLPGIAPAREMQKEGVDLGDNQTRLLAKIEELTLYIIRQNERMDTFSKELETLKKENQQLKARAR